MADIYVCDCVREVVRYSDGAVRDYPAGGPHVCTERLGGIHLCPVCDESVIAFVDGRVYAWPMLDRHACPGAAQLVGALRPKPEPAPAREPPGDPSFRLPPVRTSMPPDVKTGRAPSRTTRPV